MPSSGLDLISDGDNRNLFRQYIERYHYLGYKVPCGPRLRYFVRSRPLSNRIVACLLFPSAALKIAPRDGWIGWDDQARKCSLPRIINNSRFLILPQSRSRSLPAKSSRLWSINFLTIGLTPIASNLCCSNPLSTLNVSPTCYRAANWIHAGTTQGRGRIDRDQDVKRHVKEIFLYPLHPHAREILCRTPQIHPSSMRLP